MKDVLNVLILFGLILLAYYTIDALTTKSPTRRRRDLTDIRIVGTGLNVLRTI